MLHTHLEVIIVITVGSSLELDLSKQKRVKPWNLPRIVPRKTIQNLGVR